MVTEKFQGIAKDAKDYTYSAMFGGAAGGIPTAIATAPTLFSYAAADSLGAPTSLSVIAAAAVGIVSADATLAAAICSGGAVSLAAADYFMKNDVNLKSKTGDAGCAVGIAAALYMNISLAISDDEPHQAAVEEPIKAAQIETAPAPELH